MNHRISAQEAAPQYYPLNTLVGKLIRMNEIGDFSKRTIDGTLEGAVKRGGAWKENERVDRV